MKLESFMNVNGTEMGYLETLFLKTVFFEDYGEGGLDLIQAEVEIDRNDGTGRKFRLDFVVTTKLGKYAIECDGFSYHAAGMVTSERFDELERKRNETIRQGFNLVSLSREQIQSNPQESIFELRRSFNSDPELYSLFLGWNKDKISPHQVQQDALLRLQETRASGRIAGLVSMATGLGKTYLGIFDALAFGAKKILFVVHVDHILKQARNSFEKVAPELMSEMAFLTGKQKDFHGKSIVFATVQSISKIQNLQEFREDFFDYIIVDESHHTAAPSYQVVIDYFAPKFLLGLTATPTRMDGKEILPFYGNNLVYEMSQAEAVKQGYLVALDYRGYVDNVDYSNIFFNGSKYDISDLNHLLMIEERDNAIIDKYRELASGKKTIAFCASIEHAESTAQRFRNAGFRAVAVHSKIGFADSESFYDSAAEVISAFEVGDQEIVFVVDMFNEGIDIPEVDCLLMLRPTESSTILIQQIGRGLRISPRKTNVLILDFIGNYRTGPKILQALGITLEDLSHDKEKQIYYYDNDGKRVEFDEKVIDIFSVLAAKDASSQNFDSISQDWQDYGDYLKKNLGEENLYWDIPHKEYNSEMWMWASSFIAENKAKFDSIKSLEDAMKASWMAKSGTTMEGNRALFPLQLFGLHIPQNSRSFTEAYCALEVFYKNNDRSGFNTLLSNQIEKLFLWNDISRAFDRHKGGLRSASKLFRIYPIFAIYDVMLRLVEFGYDDGPITKLELEAFVYLLRNPTEISDCVENIVRFRLESKNNAISQYLQSIITKQKMDSRIDDIFKFLEPLSWNGHTLSIKPEYEDVLRRKVENFYAFFNTYPGSIPEHKNSEKYRKMLHSRYSLEQYFERS